MSTKQDVRINSHSNDPPKTKKKQNWTHMCHHGAHLTIPKVDVGLCLILSRQLVSATRPCKNPIRQGFCVKNQFDRLLSSGKRLKMCLEGSFSPFWARFLAPASLFVFRGQFYPVLFDFLPGVRSLKPCNIFSN